jgi:hypothetical protein
MRFFPEILHKMVSSRREFGENRLSGNGTLFKGVNKFLPVLFLYFANLGDIRYRKSPRNVIGNL